VSCLRCPTVLVRAAVTHLELCVWPAPASHEIHHVEDRVLNVLATRQTRSSAERLKIAQHVAAVSARPKIASSERGKRRLEITGGDRRTSVHQRAHARILGRPPVLASQSEEILVFIQPHYPGGFDEAVPGKLPVLRIPETVNEVGFLNNPERVIASAAERLRPAVFRQIFWAQAYRHASRVGMNQAVIVHLDVALIVSDAQRSGARTYSRKPVVIHSHPTKKQCHRLNVSDAA